MKLAPQKTRVPLLENYPKRSRQKLESTFVNQTLVDNSMLRLETGSAQNGIVN